MYLKEVVLGARETRRRDTTTGLAGSDEDYPQTGKPERKGRNWPPHLCSRVLAAESGLIWMASGKAARVRQFIQTIDFVCLEPRWLLSAVSRCLDEVFIQTSPPSRRPARPVTGRSAELAPVGISRWQRSGDGVASSKQQIAKPIRSSELSSLPAQWKTDFAARLGSP